MDFFTLMIQNLEFEAIIGILDFERKTPQKIILNAELTYEFKEKNYIDYIAVKNLIQELLQTKKYELLEEALSDISQHLKDNFETLMSLNLSIKKPNITNDCIVGVRLNKIF